MVFIFNCLAVFILCTFHSSPSLQFWTVQLFPAASSTWGPFQRPRTPPFSECS